MEKENWRLKATKQSKWWGKKDTVHGTEFSAIILGLDIDIIRKGILTAAENSINRACQVELLRSWTSPVLNVNLEHR